MTHRAVVSESDVAPHHLTHHVLQARAITATGDVPSQRVAEASTKWSKRCDISRVTSEVRQIEEIKAVPETMSDNDFANYFVSHGFPDNIKRSRARMSLEMTLFKPMNRGAIISLALDVSAPGSNAPLK